MLSTFDLFSHLKLYVKKNESAVIMGVGRAFARSLEILLFLIIFCARDLLHLKRCLITEVSCLSPRSNGKYLAHGEITNLCHAFVKRSGLGSHLGFKLVPKRKKHFFLRRIYHHCNSTASFQLDNLALCGDVHPNPGFDPEVSLIQDRNTQTISKRKNMLVHLNARSLLQHIDELRLIFSKVFPPIIAVTETWLDNSIEDSEIAIRNYSVERLDRKEEEG